VFALAVFDECGAPTPCPALYAGGNFTTAGGGAANRIAKWNGTSWAALSGGVNGFGAALAGFDDSGAPTPCPALYAGGDFTTAGGVAANRIAKWNGTSWAALGDGMNDAVDALAVFDECGAPTPCPALYAGGDFTTAGGGPALRIAKWNGTSW